MNIAEFSVKRPIAMLMLILSIMLIGAYGFSNLVIEFMPDIEFPMLTISTSYSGVAPEEMEKLVTKPIEDIVSLVSNVKKVSSTSQEGTSSVVVEFNWGTNLDASANDLRDRIGMVKKYLPEECDDPMIFKFSTKSMPILFLSLQGKRDLAQLQDLGDDMVKPMLDRINGVGNLMLIGGLTREFRVEADRDKLKAYNLSLATIKQSLGSSNMNVTGGRILRGPMEFTVSSKGEFQGVNDIENVVVVVKDGNPVYVKDIAVVKDTYAEQRMYAQSFKKNSMAIIVQKEADANTVAVAERVMKAIPEIEAKLPPDVKLVKVVDMSKFIKSSIENMERSALEGAGLAAIIIFLFLRNFNSTVVICLSIPISFLVTFIFMYFQNFTLNMMTLGGLMIAVGRLVDDSIVVLENTFRHLQAGKERSVAAIMGATEVSMPISAATITTVIVFLPLLFAKGMAGELFKSFALTVTYALLASLFVAVTLVPMFCSKILRGDKLKPEKQSGLYHNVKEFYKRVLTWSIDNRKKTLALAFLFFFFSLSMIMFIGKEFSPDADQGSLIGTITLPVGTALNETKKTIDNVEDMLVKLPEVEAEMSFMGSMGASGRGSSTDINSAMMAVKLKPSSERKRSTNDVTEDLRKFVNEIPGAKFAVQASSMGGGSSSAIEIQLTGDDFDTLQNISNDIVKGIKDIPGLIDIKNSMEEGKPEWKLHYDKQKLALYSLSLSQVANEVKDAMDGGIASRIRMKGKEYDLRVQLNPEQRKTIEDINELPILSPTGGQITLQNLAVMDPGRSPAVISRLESKRLAKITADIKDRPLNLIVEDINAELAKVTLPLGYFIKFGGEFKDMQDTFKDLVLVLIIAIFLIYMIMAAQFESLKHPLSIMFSLPFAISGAFIALFVTRQTLNITSFIGIILLMGIVVTNAIVLVDFINQQRRAGMPIKEAIISAGQIRLRPILMTAIATILAMVPGSLGLYEGSEEMQGMSIAVIGGLFTSTVLTLIIVPIMYLILEGSGKSKPKKRHCEEASEPYSGFEQQF